MAHDLTVSYPSRPCSTAADFLELAIIRLVGSCYGVEGMCSGYIGDFAVQMMALE